MKIIVLLGFLALSLSSIADDLSPFRSDGCSAFPDGTFSQQSLWLSCCRSHDLAYWRGGSHAQRLLADQALKSCVDGLGEPAVGLLMQLGVSVGGSALWPTTFRWGYGWPYPRLYGPLTDQEKAQVTRRLLER